MTEPLGSFMSSEPRADMTGAKSVMHLLIAQLEEVGAITDAVAGQSRRTQDRILICNGEGRVFGATLPPACGRQVLDLVKGPKRTLWVCLEEPDPALQALFSGHLDLRLGKSNVCYRL
jgi:hypothetical protein